MIDVPVLAVIIGTVAVMGWALYFVVGIADWAFTKMRNRKWKKKWKKDEEERLKKDVDELKDDNINIRVRLKALEKPNTEKRKVKK